MGSQRDALVRLLSRDVEFLRNNGMISYSLVLVVGKLVAPEGEKIDVSLVEQEKRGLVESAFGQWVLLAGIYNVWHRYGKREIVSTSLKVFSTPNSRPVTDPHSYADRFLDLLDTHITK